MKNDYEVRGEVTAILIKYKDEIIETLIDTADIELASSHGGRWMIVKDSNYKKAKLYVYGYVPKKNMVALHRLLMDFPEGLVVDHINNDSLDNRRSVNLQAITASENVKRQCRGKLQLS